jgi:hypothetical protein
MTPRPGDYGVLIQEKRNWFKQPVISLITAVTHSKAYHAVLVVDSPILGLSIVGAEPGGAKLDPWNHYSNVVWSQDEIGDEKRKAISDGGLKFVGREYNFYDDGFIGLTRIFKEKGFSWLWKRLSGGHSIECAQLVDADYLANDIHLFNDNRQTGQVAPSDLYDLILAGPHKY